MKERVTRAKIRDDVRLQRVYFAAREDLLRYSYVEFRRMFKQAGVLHDIAGVECALPLMRRMLSAELHAELIGASYLYFDDLKKAHYALDGHGRKLDPAKYLALNSKAKGWISVGRDCDGDLVERYLAGCAAHEKGWRERQQRIRLERNAMLLTTPPPVLMLYPPDDDEANAPGP